MKNPFEISRISLFPERGTSFLSIPHDTSPFLCTYSCQVVLNNMLVLRGLKIRYGDFGYYVSFPHSPKGVAYKFYEITSMKFRLFLEKEVLAEFHKKHKMSCYTDPSSRLTMYREGMAC
jgi:DNA-binding cell septation regulator SpoVG